MELTKGAFANSARYERHSAGLEGHRSSVDQERGETPGQRAAGGYPSNLVPLEQNEHIKPRYLLLYQPATSGPAMRITSDDTPPPLAGWAPALAPIWGGIK